jgi:hypothetical protein
MGLRAGLSVLPTSAPGPPRCRFPVRSPGVSARRGPTCTMIAPRFPPTARGIVLGNTPPTTLCPGQPTLEGPVCCLARKLGLGVSTDSARGPETTGNYRYQSGKSDGRMGRPTRRLTARFTRDGFEKSQFSGVSSALEQLPRHHHPLDLISPLVDLGDRGPWGSFRR